MQKAISTDNQSMGRRSRMQWKHVRPRSELLMNLITSPVAVLGKPFRRGSLDCQMFYLNEKSSTSV